MRLGFVTGKARAQVGSKGLPTRVDACSPSSARSVRHCWISKLLLMQIDS